MFSQERPTQTLLHAQNDFYLQKNMLYLYIDLFNSGGDNKHQGFPFYLHSIYISSMERFNLMYNSHFMAV